MLGITVVRVHGVAARATGGAIVARLFVGAEEPHVRIVEPGLRDVDDRHRDAQSRARATDRLADVRSAGLVEFLQRAGDVRQADLRELRLDDAPAALEHAEDVRGRQRFPRGQRKQLGDDPFLIEDIMGRLDEIIRLHPSAKAAVDMALYDIMGKILGVPLYKLLGLNPKL